MSKACLEKRENNEMDNEEMEMNVSKEPRIGKRLKIYLDYISENNPTTSNYDKMYLARAIAEVLSSTFDRIDKFGK